MVVVLVMGVGGGGGGSTPQNFDGDVPHGNPDPIWDGQNILFLIPFFRPLEAALNPITFRRGLFL